MNELSSHNIGPLLDPCPLAGGQSDKFVIDDVSLLSTAPTNTRKIPFDLGGDGKTDIAFWRPSTGQWYILRSEDLSFYAFPFGAAGDSPVPGDYDGDGKTDAGVFRASNSTWYINRSTAGVLIQAFGTTGDQPVPSAYVR